MNEPMDRNREADLGTDAIEGLLKQRYPTLLSIVGELRSGAPEPRLRRFVEDVRRAVEEIRASETNHKRREEAERVLRAMELAASVAIQIALPNNQK